MELFGIIDFASLKGLVNLGYMAQVLALSIISLVLVVEIGVSFVQAKAWAKENTETDVDVDVIACGDAEEVSLQEYLGGEVQIFSRNGWGNWACKSSSITVATAPVVELVEKATYSGEEYVAEEELAVPVQIGATMAKAMVARATAARLASEISKEVARQSDIAIDMVVGWALDRMARTHQKQKQMAREEEIEAALTSGLGSYGF